MDRISAVFGKKHGEICGHVSLLFNLEFPGRRQSLELRETIQQNFESLVGVVVVLDGLQPVAHICEPDDIVTNTFASGHNTKRDLS